MYEEMRKLANNNRFGSSDSDRSELRGEVQKVLDKHESKQGQEAEVAEEWLESACEASDNLDTQLESARTESVFTSIGLVQNQMREEEADELPEIVDGLGESIASAPFITEIDDDDGDSEYDYELVDGFDEEKLYDYEAMDLKPLVVGSDSTPSIATAVGIEKAVDWLRSGLVNGREDELSDRASELRSQKQTLETNANQMRKNSLNNCPHCHSVVTAPTIEDEAQRLQDRADELEDRVVDVNKRRSELQDIRSNVRSKRKDFENSVIRLVEQEVGDESVVSVTYSPGEQNSVSLHSAVDRDELDMNDSTIETVLDNARWVDEAMES
jgi:DNA repair exonuclease SbcCD ATPase subunit